MKKITSSRPARRLVTLLSATALIGTAILFDSCDKHSCRHEHMQHPPAPVENTGPGTSKATVQQTLSRVMTVANIMTSSTGAVEVIFNENTEFFHVKNDATLVALKTAFSSGNPVDVSFDPWQGEIVKVSEPSAEGVATMPRREATSGAATAMKVSLATAKDETFDNPSEIGLTNMTEPGLTAVIPDFATAQLMFDYIAHQCCMVPGPYAIDHCIPFQYCIDGCYARAHKMCFILNKRYHYDTKKIFSFANDAANMDKLCVQGQKWGGCCINWWYHVAPLVTINTSKGPKAYVFDPAMFDQPVLLSVWLHAQENPSCVPSGKNPHVTMINIRPTASYAPSGSSGYLFSTDATFSSTNSTLIAYQSLPTCH